MSLQTPINLETYDQQVLVSRSAQTNHNNLISFNRAFMRQVEPSAQFVEITGCEVPIYMVISETEITFACKSKVIRAYVFCLLINYLYDPEFSLAKVNKKYNFEQFLSPTRLKAMANLADLIAKISREDLRAKLTTLSYTFS